MIALKCKENVSLTRTIAVGAAWRGEKGVKNRSHYYTLPFFRPRVILFVWGMD